MPQQRSLSHLSLSKMTVWSFWKHQIFVPFLSHRRRILAVLLSLVLVSASTAALIFCLGPFMKLMFVMAHDESLKLGDLFPPQILEISSIDATRSIPMSWLVVLLPLIMLLAGCAKALAGYIYQLNQQFISLAVSMRLRVKLFERIIAKPYVDLSRHDAGSLMSTLMNDVAVIRAKLGDIITHVARDVLIVFTAIVTMMIVNWRGAIFLVVLAPFMAWSLGRGGGRIAKFSENWQSQLRELASQVLDVRRRFDFMRAQSGEEWERRRFSSVNNQYLHSIRKSLMIRSAYAPVVEWIGIGLFAIYVSYFFGGAVQVDLVGDSIQFLAALGLMVKPLKSIGEQFVNLAEAQGSLRQAMKLFEGVDIRSIPSDDSTASHQGRLRSFKVQELVVMHRGGPSVRISNVALNLGEVIGIVGPSGAGKSTIAKCFGGLIQPETAAIDVLDWSAIKASVSYVSQSPFLFDQSIRENLSYGINADLVDDNAIWQALDMVEMSEVVRQSGAGLDTKVAKFSVNFSGGQLQRLTIARGLLRSDRDILFLDEATSGLDVQTESSVLRKLRDYARAHHKIIIMVTHRTGIFDLFDRLLFLESGELKGSGTHAELMAHRRYAEFCRSEN